MNQGARESEAFFLPNFCEARSVFIIILTGEILAFLLALANGVGNKNFWSNLGLISLMIQWVALSSAGILCLLKNKLAYLSILQAAIFSYTVVLLITTLYSLLALLTFFGASLAEFATPHWQILLENVLIAGVVAAVTLRYFHLQQQYRLRLSMESEARAQALQSRIHPHFLFNSMNIIASLTRSDPALAEQVVEDLSDLFRASLHKAGKLVSLEEEVELCLQYGNIEKLRLGDRLAIHWRIETDTKTPRIPLLTIQPLLENAIYHGIEPLTEGGDINIVIERQGKQIVITIANPYPEKKGRPKSKGNQIALKNIEERLSVLFGEKASLKCDYSKQLYLVTLQIPNVGGRK